MTVVSERPERFTNTAEAEAALHALVNRSRAEAGLPALVLDERLTRIARGHSAEMARLGTVAHVLPATGDAADRVKAAGLRPRFIAENVGMAHSVLGVHEGLLGSPGHRANILHKEPTRVGIGVVPKLADDGRALLIYVTELFAAGLE
jgi:uncharacterized protein YkwD